jgi:phage I-like protein
MNTEVSTQGATGEELRRLASRTVESPKGEIASRVLAAPWGEVESSNGDFLVDEIAGALVVEAFKKHGTDIPIDYEHQTLGGTYASPSGRAPAAGWIKSLEVVPNEGIFATVEWTEEARRQLASKEYRYLSPVAMVRKRDRRMVALHSAALTNKPAIAGMCPIVNRSEGSANQDEAVEALRCRLELESDADLGALLTAAGRRIDELAEQLKAKDAEDRVLSALRAGKLTEAQKGWALALARRSPEMFEKWEATAPVVMPLAVTKAPMLAGPSQERTEKKARQEFRRHPELALLTDEDAYVADALRHAG